MIKQQVKTNFGAGPAALPSEVLSEAAAAILNYQNTGMSILEIPHRGPLFAAILQEAKELVLSLTHLSADEYEVFWLQGGGRLQFAMVPMNFLQQEATAGFIDSGHWAREAQDYADFYGHTKTLASSAELQYRCLPSLEEPIPEGLSYVHLTTNNTIYGTQIKEPPLCKVPLIADMSSDIFSDVRDYRPYDLFYAVAQKNIGPAGVTLVVIKKEMLSRIVRPLAPIFDYKQHAKHQSVLNTPAVFAIYASMINLRWIQRQGINQVAHLNKEKAQLLYDEIDRNTLLMPIAEKSDRSMMNVVFRTTEVALEKELIAYCKEHGVENIEGHRTLGGLRVSLYNAISLEQVASFVAVLQQFEQENLN